MIESAVYVFLAYVCIVGFAMLMRSGGPVSLWEAVKEACLVAGIFSIFAGLTMGVLVFIFLAFGAIRS